MKSLFFCSKKMQFFCLLLLSFCFSSCLKDALTKRYTILRPVYEDKSKVLAGIGSSAPRQLGSPGKIYMYGHYIFVNEVDKGVHVIDNIDPGHPKPVAFISIPGNIDIAVKGSALYADMFNDMLVIDISDPLHASLADTINNVFPGRYYYNGFTAQEGKVIVDWIKKDTVIDMAVAKTLWNDCPVCGMVYNTSSSSQSTQAPGIGGSMSRFAIVNNTLYTVNYSSLASFDISNANTPRLYGISGIGVDIETIYPLHDKLFIGSSTGLLIYDISSPGHPVNSGNFSHARACDPVIADGNIAYVTLRTGTVCSGTTNELDVVDVSNMMSAKLLRSYPMANPRGLAKAGKYLFVCDGLMGLKVFDAADNNNLQQVGHYFGMNAYDVIAWNNKLLLVGGSGLYQYDCSDGAHLKLLSKIGVHR